VVRLVATALAAGGAAVARQAGGRVVLVEGALPGETIDAMVTSEHANYARASLVAVLESSPDRVSPPCPNVARGCGGCGWQHVSADAQRRAKLSLVTEALVRLGGVDQPRVEDGPALPSVGYRTTLRMAVGPDGAGFRRYHGHDVVEVGECLVAHPLLAELVATGRFGSAREVTLRCGAGTGDRLALLAPSAAGAVLPPPVLVVGEDELDAGRRAWIFEEVAGTRLRVSARSFFQASPAGAEALVGAVTAAVAGAGPGELVDAYGGVGLFGATAGAGRPVTVLERSPSSAADARANLASAKVRANRASAKVLRLDVERWRPSPAAAVVADPPKAGLGRRAVSALAASGAGHLVLVSCDPASLGRDAGLLRAKGFELRSTTVVDMFPGTPHIETVSLFVR
jgi:23S rRNA (uracil1939-C5)-methyltransferase